jgi:putative spermidine/putrescine transport system substrate-binding protein
MAQGPQVLGDGEAAILSTVSGRLLAANRQAGKNFGIVWDKQSYSVNIVIIPKGTNADLAMKLLAYKLKPEVMARVPQYVEYGPTRKSAMQYVDAKIAPNLPTAPDHMKNATPRHEAWWADHIQEAQEKWAVLMSKW